MKKRVHIENLRIRINSGEGITDPKNFASGLAREIMNGIARASAGGAGKIRIDEVSTNKIPMTGGGETEVQKKASAGIAAEVTKRIKVGG